MQTVLGSVHLIVSLTPVDARTDGVLPVLLVGWVIIVPQVMPFNILQIQVKDSTN